MKTGLVLIPNSKYTMVHRDSCVAANRLGSRAKPWSFGDYSIAAKIILDNDFRVCRRCKPMDGPKKEMKVKNVLQDRPKKPWEK